MVNPIQFSVVSIDLRSSTDHDPNRNGNDNVVVDSSSFSVSLMQVIIQGAKMRKRTESRLSEALESIELELGNKAFLWF